MYLTTADGVDAYLEQIGLFAVSIYLGSQLSTTLINTSIHIQDGRK
jgi:hypothetical protein